jgi:integrase
VDFDNNIIVYMGKDGQPKSVPIVAPLRAVLEKLPHDNQYVFTFRGHRIYEFKTAWRAAFEKSGIPYLNFHALRHTTATWLLRQTGNLRLVQQVLGHTNITTTTKYAHLVNTATENAMNETFKNN